MRDGHQVRVVASRNALRFLWAHLVSHPARIGTFVTRFRPQLRETLAYVAHSRIGVPHIAEGKWADVAVMAPATCNSIGKLVAGIGDNYPLLVVRAVPRTKRVIVVPSINPEMWFDPHFQRNVDLLNATEKYQVLCPSRGQMASGDFGIGAQAPFEEIVAQTYQALGFLDKASEAALRRHNESPWSAEADTNAPQAETSQTILAVDEDRALREQIAGLLTKANPAYRVVQFDRPAQALEWLRTNQAALVFSELSFANGATGYDLVEFLRRPGSSPGCQIVVTSAKDRREVGAERLAREDVLFLPKPLNMPFTIGMFSGLIGGKQRAPAIAHRTLEAGEVLFSEGDAGSDVYLVESGSLKIVKRRAGEEQALSVVSGGEIVGEMAFLTRATRSATVIAVEPTRLARIEVDQFYDYLDRQPIWLRTMIETVVRRLRDTAARSEIAGRDV